MLDFSMVQASGLTQVELAKVLGVSRTTVNLWFNGKMNPHRLHAEHVERRMELLSAALRKNLIPKQTGRRKPRHAEIEKALQLAATEQ